MFRYYLIIFLNISIVFFCCGSSTESFEIEEEVSYVNFIKYPDYLHLFVFNRRPAKVEVKIASKFNIHES